MAPKRPALSSLVQRKPEAAPAPAAVPAQDAAVSSSEPKAKGTTDLKTMQVRVNRAGWLEMSRLAQDLDKPLEELMIEAFNDVLVKHGKPPVAERRQPVR